MKRLFKFGRGKKKERKERLSPPEFSSPPPTDGFQAATSPMYQYARNEFAQTVAAGTSNDDGRGVLYSSPSDTPSRLFTNLDEELRQSSLVANAASSQSFSQTWMSPLAAQNANDQQNHNNFSGPFDAQNHNGTTANDEATSSVQENQTLSQPQQSIVNNGSGSIVTSRSSSLIEGEINQSRSLSSITRQRQGPVNQSFQPPYPAQDSVSQLAGYQPPTFANKDSNHNNANNPTTLTPDTTTRNPTYNNIDPDYIAACSASNLGRQESLFSQTSSQYRYPSRNPSQLNNQKGINNNQHLDYPPSWEMPDATYEEEYGDAYIGGPIRYIYPSGYQSMRPRSGPWKLSIVVCMLFTWLSVFIVGHCSDRVDSDVSQYNQSEIDDDTLVIETRWCGSRLLYMMWVISMLVTGLAAAYCSIIGYIKVRDFAVANSRSQPPGMVGKTDFYAQIDDAAPPPIQPTSSQGSYASSAHRNNYHVPIYQADGNPQFWGGHIYRPTQAAVAITSR